LNQSLIHTHTRTYLHILLSPNLTPIFSVLLQLSSQRMLFLGIKNIGEGEFAPLNRPSWACVTGNAFLGDSTDYTWLSLTLSSAV